MSSSTVSKSASKLDLKTILVRLSKMTGSLGGLDACVMLAQYSSPLVIALLLRLGRLKASLRSLPGGNSVIGAGASDQGSLQMAKGLGNVAASLTDARAVMRAFGTCSIVILKVKITGDPFKVSYPSYLASRDSTRGHSLPSNLCRDWTAQRPSRHYRPCHCLGFTRSTTSFGYLSRVWSLLRR